MFEVQLQGTQPKTTGDSTPRARRFRSVDGRFEWQHLPAGEWTVIARALGYQRFEFDKLQLRSGFLTREIVLPLRRGHRLGGRIYDEESGAGIGGASIELREAGSGRFDRNWRTRARATSATDGTFVLDGLPAGPLTLDIYAKDHAGRELDVMVREQTPPVEISLSAGGAVSGYLTAADHITRITGSTRLFSLEQPFGRISRTGDEGEFSFEHLPPGKYQLIGRSESGSAARELVLEGNQRIEGIALALQTGRSIQGVVNGLNPEDLKRLSISLRRQDGDSAKPHADVRLDERGAYVVRGVQPGRVQIIADVSMRRKLTKSVEVPPDSDVTVNLDFLPGARLSGRVTRGGQPLSNVWMEPSAIVMQSLYVYGTMTSKDGTYAIEELPSSEYVLFIGDYMSKPVQVSGDTVFDVDVPELQLAGRVLEEGSDVPIVGVDVELWPTEPTSGQRRLHERSNDFGRFDLAGLERGEYLLTAYKRGYEMFRYRISYDAPVFDMIVRLRQEPGVEIRVREAVSGTPVDRVSVVEVIGGRNGSQLVVPLNAEGVGYIPTALVGNRLSFSAFGYATLVRDWNGESLNLHLEPQETR